MHFGFSYIGLIFLIMLMVPNLIWTRNLPKDYEKYASGENRFLLVLERIGQVSVTILVLIFKDLNIHLSPWVSLLLTAFILMIFYEMFWIRYFRSPKTMKDYYSSFLGVPVAGATLPVVAFFILSVYGRNPILGIAVIILGIGHIGIHVMHKNEAICEQDIKNA